MSVVILPFVETKISVNLLRMVSEESALKRNAELVAYDSPVILTATVACGLGC